MISTTLVVGAQAQQAAGTPNFTNPENVLGPSDGLAMTATVNNSQTSQKLRLTPTIPASIQGSRFHGCKLDLGGYSNSTWTNQNGGLSIRMLTATNAEVGTAIARALEPGNLNGFRHETELAGFFDNLTTAQVDTLANFGGISLLAFVSTNTGFGFSLDNVGFIVQHSAAPLTCANTSTLNMASVASGAGTGTKAWTNPNNASGAVNTTYAVSESTNNGVVGQMDTEELQGVITGGALAALSMVYPKQIRIHLSGVKFNDVDGNNLINAENPFLAHAAIQLKFRNAGGTDLSIAPMEGDIVEIPFGSENRRTYTFTIQNQADIAALIAALDVGGKICVKFVGTLDESAVGFCNLGYEVDTIQLEMGWDNSAPASPGSGAGFRQAASFPDSLLMIVDEDLLEQFEKDSKR